MSERRSNAEIFAAHAGFVLTGAVCALLGPMLPALAARWSLDDARAGYLFTIQCVGALAGTFASNRLLARGGVTARRLVAAGFLFIAIGVAGLNAASWRAGAAAVALYGAGLGVVIPLTTLIVSDAFPQRRAAALNVLNFAWGLGAALCAPLLAAFSSIGGRTSSAAIYAISFAAIPVAFLMARARSEDSDEDAPRETTTNHARESQTTNGANAKSETWALAFAAAFAFLYVGVESSIGDWTASYALRLNSAATNLHLAATFAFWSALLGGRALAPIALRRLTPESLIRFGLLTATAGCLVLLKANTGAVLFGVALCGFGLAPVFPTMLALLPRRFGTQTARANASVFFCATLGGATLPLLVGVLSSRYASLRAGLLAALCGLLLMESGYELGAMSERRRMHGGAR